MASISRAANGTVRILFTDRNGDRKPIRLGRMSEKNAATIVGKVEKILEAQLAVTALDPDIAKWLANVPERLHSRLVALGLAEPRARAATVSLGGLLAAFFAGVAVKPATRVRMKQAESALVGHFTKSRDVATIGEADADAWRAKLKEQGYASATISRTVLYARQIFRWAIRRGMARANPFSELKAGSQVNTARAMFISRETIAKVIDAAPDAEWRLLIALSRFGGLRVPSEALALRWSDVDWEHNRMTVRSPKTEHHEGKGERMVPIFAEVLPHLRAVFEQAPAGSVNVIGRYREGANLNPHFRRIIKRAGLSPWERTWHNLRASRQTELASTFPLHTVCAWIGNTKAIAAGHYLQVTDADWTRATAGTGAGSGSGAKCGARDGENTARKPAQHTTASVRGGRREASESPCFVGVSPSDAPECDATQSGDKNDPMGRAGLEQSREPSGNMHVSLSGGAESGAHRGDSASQPAPATPPLPPDPDLAAIVAAWPDLPPALRSGIAAMVKAATPATPPSGPKGVGQ